MADPTLSSDTPLLSRFSSFQPTVSLYDWWLIKAENDFEGKRLAVAGVSSRKKEAIRVFVSAPIVKRYDVFSLETADGVHVIISGFINEQRTLENGFAPEVFNSFVFGFPPNWESYALDCHREESKAGTDSGNSDMDKEEGIPSSDNVSALSEILSDGCFGEETKVATDLENAVTDNNGEVPSSDNVFTICPENLSDGCLGEEESKVGTDQGNAVTDNDGDVPSSDNISTICPVNLSDGAKKSNPTSLVLPEEAPRNCRKSLPEDECSALTEMSGIKINAANGIGRTRRSARLDKHNIKACQQKQPAAESPPKHPDKDHSTTSAALENCDGRLGSPSTPIQSQSKELLSTLSEQLVKKSASRISRMLSAKTEGCNKKKKRIAKTEAKRKIIKPASSVTSPQERDVSHLDKGSKQNISLVSLESPSLRKSRSACFGEESKAGTSSGNAVTDNEEGIPLSDNILRIGPEILSDGAEKFIPTSLVFPEEGPGNCEKPPLPQDKCNVSREMSGADVAYGSSRNRRSARLHSHGFRLFQQKKQQPATESPPKHPDKDHSSTSAALENCDGGLESPSTPIHSQTKGLLNTSEQLVKKSASRFSRTLSVKTEGCNKKSRRIAKTEAVSRKRKITKPACSVESHQERDVSHLNKGSKQEIPLVSPESLSLRKSRSGRLLIPPLEFWRNQIPIYNADHEVTEIQEGASLASPSRGSPASLNREGASLASPGRGSPASLSRSNNQKARNAQHDM